MGSAVWGGSVAASTEHRYRDAGATDVVVSVSELDGHSARLSTWELLGELA
ncbi:hypothetical protein ACFCWG_13370 [Streptomyces sp. NPDC056390]|uniref:hypothetical protein n=1 Tax=Streptomyces sp. NPDC056390 TaxID=3345806 RepID=UPI0035DA9685